MVDQLSGEREAVLGENLRNLCAQCPGGRLLSRQFALGSFIAMRFSTSLLVAAHFFAVSASASDWPQWRGPLRNGIAPDSPKLLDSIPEAGLKELWESEAIPANDEGGLSSPVVVGGKVYLGVVWHRDVPSETRQIDELVLRQLGHQATGNLGPAIVAEMEKARLSLSPTLRGGKLEAFTQEWIDKNLNKNQKQLFSGMINRRFKQGALAIPLEVLDALDKHKSHVFPNDAAMKHWLNEQGWSEAVQQQIIAAVPPTERVAEDAVICVDLTTGKTLWLAKLPGAPLGRSASATVCVAEGKVYAIASKRVWCVDATSGKVVWETPLLGKRAVGSSPLVADGVVVVNADGVRALDAATGRELWRDEKAGGSNSSPVMWKGFVLCNSRNELQAFDLKNGSVAWTAPGGGDSTPAIAGDVLAMQAKSGALGLVAYRLAPDGATKLWNFPIDGLRTQASPIIHEGFVYHMEDNVHYCFDLETGAQRWQAPGQSTIASPTLVDGKIFVMANSGNSLLAIKASPDERVELGKATVRAQWVPSPCIADGRLVLRMKDKLKCWDLAAR
jgi:outer membrane protein assembly factor BamB